MSGHRKRKGTAMLNTFMRRPCRGLLSASRAVGYAFSCSSGSFSPVLGSLVQISVDLSGQTCSALQEEGQRERQQDPVPLSNSQHGWSWFLQTAWPSW